MLPTVIQVFSTRSFDLIISFDDGKVVRWNAKHLLLAGGVFEKIKNPEVFHNELTVLNGTVAWSHDFDPETCVDLDPLVLYHEGVDIRQPV